MSEPALTNDFHDAPIAVDTQGRVIWARRRCYVSHAGQSMWFHCWASVRTPDGMETEALLEQDNGCMMYAMPHQIQFTSQQRPAP